jgi:methylamine dehydrogenase accessory protein MauD
MNGVWLLSYVVLWVIVALLVIFSLAAARQIGLLHSHLSKVTPARPAPGEIGSTCPSIDCVDLEGKPTAMTKHSGRVALLAFVSPDCGSCDEISLLLRDIQENLALDITIASVVDDVVATAEFVNRNKLDGIPCILAPAAADRIGIAETPMGLLLDGHAKIIGKLALLGITDVDRLQQALGIAFATKGQITATL